MIKPSPWHPSRDCSVHAIYRISPTRKSEVRPEWFTQHACLRSFIDSAEAARAAGARLRSTVIVDGELDAELLAELGWFDEQHHIRVLGNSPAFRCALDAAISRSEEITFFAEDDYLWTPGAVVNTVRVLAEVPEADYASPYAHPVAGDRSLRDVRRHRPVTVPAGDVVWCSTPRTTMTFACRTSALRADRQYWWLATYGKSPKDGYAFRAIVDGRWFTLVGNAAFRDPRRVLNRGTLRVIRQCTARRFRLMRRRLLLQPTDGLATHVHRPYITGSADWSRISQAHGEGPT